MKFCGFSTRLTSPAAFLGSNSITGASNFNKIQKLIPKSLVERLTKMFLKFSTKLYKLIRPSKSFKAPISPNPTLKPPNKRLNNSHYQTTILQIYYTEKKLKIKPQAFFIGSNLNNTVDNFPHNKTKFKSAEKKLYEKSSLSLCNFLKNSSQIF